MFSSRVDANVVRCANVGKSPVPIQVAMYDVLNTVNEHMLSYCVHTVRNIRSLVDSKKILDLSYGPCV